MKKFKRSTKVRVNDHLSSLFGLEFIVLETTRTKRGVVSTNTAITEDVDSLVCHLVPNKFLEQDE